ncbi:MAG TPA: hypothetical protein VKN99_11635, partial [Polyangia bacterium]|nr:hypothetical protein [Polyangia bacterium]
DDAGVRLALTTPNGIFTELPNIAFDDGTHGTYDAKLPDVLMANAGASVDLIYGGGAAAVSTDRSVALGFPFETIYGRGSRVSVIGRILEHLNVAKDRIPIPGPAHDAGCGCAVGRAQVEGAPARAQAGLALLGLLALMGSRLRPRGRAKGRARP